MEPAQRRERFGRVVGERRRLRAIGAGEHVPRGERVADEHGVGDRHVDRDAAGGVARHADHARRPGEVEHVAVAHDDDLGERRGAQPVLPQCVPEESGRRADLEVTPFGLRGHLAAGTGRVCLMHVDRHTVLAAEPLGEADVVGVAVGEHHAADVGERPAHRLEFVGELVPLPREAGVDDGDALGRVDEVDGHDVGADAVEGGAELHRCSLPVVVCRDDDGYAT
jgi:hypothetical protein